MNVRSLNDFKVGLPMNIYKKLISVVLPLLLATNGFAYSGEKDTRVRATPAQMSKTVLKDTGNSVVKAAPAVSAVSLGLLGAYRGAVVTIPVAGFGLAFGIGGATGGFIPGVVPICTAVALAGPIAGFAVGSTIGYLGAKAAIAISKVATKSTSNYVDHVIYIDQAEGELAPQS